MVVKGFKALNKNMANSYDEVFVTNKLYSIMNNDPLKSGPEGNGYHFATKLEDTMRYVNADSEEVNIVEVVGIGDIRYFSDEYYGYEDMCVCKHMYVDRIYSRKEIIEYFLNLNIEHRVDRFIRSYKLNKEEVELFVDKYADNTKIIMCIEYYQKNNKSVYSLKYHK